MLCDGVPLQSVYKTLQGVWWEIGGGKGIKKKHLNLPILQKELKLAFGIDMIIVMSPSFCNPSMERVLNALR